MRSITLFILILPSILFSQNVGIGTTSPDASAKLEIQSSTGGVLIPRLTSAERDAIPSPIASGLLIYNSSNSQFEFWNGTAWGPIASASSGASEISDLDADTKILTEASPDEDTIKFMVKGKLFGKMDGQTLHLEADNLSTLVGLNAGKSLPSSHSWNTFIGYRSGESTSTGISNTFLGAFSGSEENKGNSNSFLGVLSGNENTGSNNTFLGIQAGQLSSSSSDNTYIGAVAGGQNTGTSNIGVGYFASYLGSGSNNIGIGRYSLFNTANGVSNLVAIGDSTLHKSGQNAILPFQGINNTAIGNKALKKNNTGTNNTALGKESLENNTSGFNNTAVGNQSGNLNNGGSGNTSLGSLALTANEEGDHNVAVGFEAGRASEGSRNTYIGTSSGASNLNGSGNVFIGYKAGENNLENDKLIIANSNASLPLIEGDFQNRTVNINETVLIENHKNNDSTLNINSTGNNTISIFANNSDPTSNVSTAEFQSSSGFVPTIRVINNEDGEFANIGGYFLSRGQYGRGVYGLSANDIDGEGIGGEFLSFGELGIGVLGKSTLISGTTNYGGYFTAAGISGIGTFTRAHNTQGIGLLAQGGKLAAHLDGDTKVSGNVAIGSDPGSARLEISTGFDETPMDVVIGGQDAFRIHGNGGLSIGSSASPPQGGLLIHNLGNTGDFPLRVNDAGIIYKDEQSRYKSYSPPSFVDNPFTGLTTNNSPSFRVINNGTFIWTDWGLPHNSVAKTFRIYFSNADTNESIRVEIMKKPISSGGSPIELANFLLFGAGSSTVATGSIVLNETIDNQNNSYYFRIWNENTSGAVFIYGVTQSYRQ